ncbi:MAG: hypothetical protein PUC59_03305 [Firmicutes bacterium]|nr:hypothetical protein [Bacillota bacterium]
MTPADGLILCVLGAVLFSAMRTVYQTKPYRDPCSGCRRFGDPSEPRCAPDSCPKRERQRPR